MHSPEAMDLLDDIRAMEHRVQQDISAAEPAGAEVLRRALDLLGAALGLTLATPLMAAAAAAIWLTMGPPVLFRQRRLGRYERPFTLLKFRTMRPADERAPSPSNRLTRMGRMLRQFSIDELPQLWNVLRGDMSLVGPRPLYAEYLPYYTARERNRHRVRPGITGLAQVSGRNRSCWDDRLALDVRYVERRSLGLDLWIILKTLDKVIRRSDVMDRALEGSLAEHRHK